MKLLPLFRSEMKLVLLPSADILAIWGFGVEINLGFYFVSSGHFGMKGPFKVRGIKKGGI
jgi:hypothetical protein